ncbi:MAG TPA: YHS domain-containing protein [Gemmataceae bacterium]|nr:YHS domain-containing protein [Gemmataceae bacterium]
MYAAACLLLTMGLTFPDDRPNAKTALEAFNEFVGEWNGSGAPDKPRADPKDAWRETAQWSWRFKGGEAALILTIEDGKLIKGGELRYLPETKRYSFTEKGKDGEKRIYQGEVKNGYLTLDFVDKKTGETKRLTLNSAGDGLRFIYKSAHKPEGRTLFIRDYQVAFSKKGETFAASEKKPECVVTGGLGTSTVVYKGTTYYLCCSGCRDAFNENPEKYIKESEARKKKR